MKIVYISDSSIPSHSANSIHVMKMCRAFASLGHEVTLWAKRTRASRTEVSDPFAFYGVERNFELRLYPGRAFPGSGRWYNLMLFHMVLGREDLRYTRSIYACLWSVIFRRKIAWEIHESFKEKSFFLGTLASWLVRSSFVFKLVAISDALKKHLVSEYGLAGEKVIVAHDGADDNRPATPANLRQGQRPLVGYTGSLLRGKGAEVILNLAPAFPGVDFHVVGGTAAQVASMKEQGAALNVHFHGFVEPSQVSAYLQAFDILLAPYQDEVFVKAKHNSVNIARWMSPLKIFEYMAAGKPILVSDLPVLREVLTHDHNAYFCRPADTPAWSAGLERLLQSSELSARLGRQASMDFKASFTWSERARRIVKGLEADTGR